MCLQSKRESYCWPCITSTSSLACMCHIILRTIYSCCKSLVLSIKRCKCVTRNLRVDRDRDVQRSRGIERFMRRHGESTDRHSQPKNIECKKGRQLRQIANDSLIHSTVKASRKGEIMRTLSSAKQLRDAASMPSDNKGFRKFMAKETYWFHMSEECKSLVSCLSITDGEILPTTFMTFFHIARLCHSSNGFAELQGKIKNAATSEEQDELTLSSKRVVWKYMFFQ
ncbi:hypothetical protein O6H91_20G050000 [Diphasiastrum complanatum]|uniref:Uncharacterized protein n=1 Tax=Diphasiastrum complanatum TaxID=34168 RepID=A0ACC2AQ69_DIPCM|nr:hypothetical protein O6H91_20G050000 [Diphasiastrum complanatum]